VRATDLIPDLADTWKSAQVRIGDSLTPTVRLGVTGLARSGKTVFITALVRALTEGARLPFFKAHAEGRIVRAYLEPQPDDNLPRFEYESHVAALTGPDPLWPAGTRRISQLRLTIEYEPRSGLRSWLGRSKLHVDIVDYPGEWLLDLGLMDQRFDLWSAETLALLKAPHRAAHAGPFLDFVGSLDPSADPEPAAIKGAKLYTALLAAERASEEAAATLGPGRFLMPGDLEGSPLLTFFPLPSRAGIVDGSSEAIGSVDDGSPLRALLARRFESYRVKVVAPFFRDHFARLDRQIVLVDALGALNRGALAMADLDRALTSAMRAFRPGGASWLPMLFGHRIDRVLFAATKADHLDQASHVRLEGLLRHATERAAARVTSSGAEATVLALAAVRATREVEVEDGSERLPVLMGTPVAGERIAGTVFDGRTEAGVFPGDVPAVPEIAFDPARTRADDVAFVRFRPPVGAAGTGHVGPLPHIRLDRAIEFLIGDALA
jgi:predicted YcjX-like family ATPase